MYAQSKYQDHFWRHWDHCQKVCCGAIATGPCKWTECWKVPKSSELYTASAKYLGESSRLHSGLKEPCSCWSLGYVEVQVWKELAIFDVLSPWGSNTSSRSPRIWILSLPSMPSNKVSSFTVWNGYDVAEESCLILFGVTTMWMHRA